MNAEHIFLHMIKDKVLLPTQGKKESNCTIRKRVRNVMAIYVRMK
jgi:hypothetical protein